MKMSGEALLALGMNKIDADKVMEAAARASSLEEGEAVVSMVGRALVNRALGIDYLAPLGLTVALYVMMPGWRNRTVIYDVESQSFHVMSGHAYLARWLRQHNDEVAAMG